ncbi:serine/threonine-protein kinase pim-1-like [Antennarius striatus]|uniref:serine/threonine-protein kinase pim-1-like n=1 Tax=Antennarius striatus TaxID=241820 RepID=UPI0035B4C698
MSFGIRPSSIVHPSIMAQPAETTLPQNRVHAGKLRSLQDCCVGDHIPQEKCARSHMVTRSKRKETNDHQSPREPWFRLLRKWLRTISDLSAQETEFHVDKVRPTEKDNPQGQPDDNAEHIWIKPSSNSSSRDDFETKYEQREEIGRGFFGSVYAGYRRSDNLPVAIKYIDHEKVEFHEVIIKNEKYEIPREVLIMQRVAGGPESVGKSPAVTLMDWYSLDCQLILVMERPEPCQTLEAYAEEPLSEHQAKNITRQLLAAMSDMLAKGVLHDDMKSDNILVELSSDVPRVRLIDFGCDTFVGTKPLPGLPDYEPMTAAVAGSYAVLQMVQVNKDIMGRHKVYYWTDERLRALSQEYQDFMSQSSHPDDTRLVTLEDLQQHPWIRQN